MAILDESSYTLIQMSAKNIIHHQQKCNHA